MLRQAYRPTVFYSHLLKRQANFPAHILAPVLGGNVQIPGVVIGGFGRLAVFVPTEEIKLHLGAEGKRNPSALAFPTADFRKVRVSA